MKKYLIILLGPTGVGKTDLSISLAQKYSTEIISSDSRQFYKELCIGTAVPEKKQLQAVKHHFIQFISVTDYYNASMFEFDAVAELEKLYKKHDVVFMVGGSGMYIDAVCKGIDDIPDIDMELREDLSKRIKNEGLESLRAELKKVDPDFYATADLKNTQRILRAMEVYIQTGKSFSSFRTQQQKKRPFEIIKIGLNRDRKELYERINSRVDKMIVDGLESEAKNVEKHRNNYALKTVGYREFFDYFDGKTTKDAAIKMIKQNTRRYARRQLTWFRRDTQIQWFHPEDTEAIYLCLVNALQATHHNKKTK
ncbi:MAG: tRNA (adenosine(37)-N6)-dimethylallyltransferase MiaA [Bacteroidetes bacterium RIFOXYA12_FULL_35_11]|nr:MAG: tRNA (adenosine(37)-N6)-dimethylallyltransferase MiaA [Bacteroidetes bacterium GWF2_35_48]OFY73938.1 MAG: tRNA (adenosine(37)-N6)-dimethylallyltransferase MiaA [Bacteroidetes bacterium RIFOXYA12_FULL_35_11]OFY92950.1 MAG: tRNA (adenosine(37)-N6)-dimethylallyltransferase MiaA [Bacteroidetes bacterium RIFOXYC12_FULL_35_7]HBX49785.1 tRNA (adenosine(37)-N6)-dimethylallyltransferase MiaA [Bacteroidales bacterium]